MEVSFRNPKMENLRLTRKEVDAEIEELKMRLCEKEAERESIEKTMMEMFEEELALY